MTVTAIGRTRRQPWGRFAAKAALLLAGLYAAGSYAAARYRIGIDAQISRCLPGTHVVLIDRYDRDVPRGELVAFASRGMSPWFKDGTTMVKVVDGLPGDTVSVSEQSVTVNGHEVGQGLVLAPTLKKPAGDFVRELTVQPGTLWVMGRTLDSYDSRYWGMAVEAQVIGRAYRLF